MFIALFLLVTIQVASGTTKVSSEDLTKLSRANNNLAASIYPKLIKGHSENVFFLPLSLTTGLGIMLDGAKGKTQEELYSVLGYKSAGLPLEKIKPTYNYYLTNELPQNKPLFPYYDLWSADQVLVTNKEKLNETFRKEEQHEYETRVQNVDFSHHAKVTKSINDYTRSHTYRKITHVVKDVSSKTSALLVDATFFKGKWETPFPRYWSYLEKFDSPTGRKNVPFMLAIHSFPYYENEDFQAIFFPYIGGFLGLLVLEPRGNLSKLETMAVGNIVSIIPQLQDERTLVLLPKFKFEYEQDYAKIFEELGASSVFKPHADFSGMTSSKDLFVSKVLHKARLEVDEANEGTGLSVDFSPPFSKSIFVNQPFLFAVVDIRHTLVLGMGRVINI